MGKRAEKKKQREELRKKIFSILSQVTQDWLYEVAAKKLSGDWNILIMRRYNALCKQLPEVFPSRLRDATIQGMLRKIIGIIDNPIEIAVKAYQEAKNDSK